MNFKDPSGHLPQIVIAALGGFGFGAVVGAVAYFIDYGPNNIHGATLGKYILRNAAWGALLGVTFSGVSAGFIVGAVQGAFDYFITTPKSKWNPVDVTKQITIGAAAGAIGGKVIPSTSIGKAVNKVFRKLSRR